MFREMRRKKQLLPYEEALAILRRGTSGVLALHGDEGYPYAVPLSYAVSEDGGSIYFHGAKTGHKVDAIRTDAKASFCVVDRDEVVPLEYTTYFRSVIAFGQMRIVEEEREKRAVLELLAKRYAPQDSKEHRDQSIEAEYAPVCILELRIEHMTGKEAIELVRRRGN